MSNLDAGQVKAEKQPKRVFIADPSFQDWLGHHAPYDFSVRDALKKAGVESLILANKVVNIADEDKNGTVKKVFSKTSWGQKTAKPKLNRWPHRMLLALHPVFLLLSLPFVVVLSVVGLPVLLPSFLSMAASVLRRLAEPVPVQLSGSQSTLRWFFNFIRIWFIPEFFRDCLWAAVSFLEFLRRLYLRFWSFFNNKFLAAFCPPIFTSFLGTLRPTLRELTPPHWLAWLLAGPQLANYYEFVEALEEHDFGPGDIVFGHMLTLYSLPVWALLASRLSEKKSSGEAVVLFRYPHHFVYNGGAKAFMWLRLMEKAFLKGAMRGATDSILLAEEYADFFAVPLVVYPICHIPDFTPASHSKDRNKTPLLCVSLGNARAEKGIVEIFEAIELLNVHGYGENFHFILQVNDPDADCAEAVQRFMGTSPPNVEFVTSPLSPQEYEKILLNADVVLAPYWSDVYKTRTSGVTLEGLTCGKIVVSAKDSWMEHELTRFEAACQLVASRDPKSLAYGLALIARNPRPYLKQAQVAARKAREFHNGKVLAEKLLGRSKSLGLQARDKVLVCYPFANLYECKAGNALRGNLLIRLLKSHGHEIKVFMPEQDCLPPSGIWPDHEAVIFHEPQPWNLFIWCIHLFNSIFKQFDSSEPFLLPFFYDFDYQRDFKLAITRSLLGCKVVIVEYPFMMRQVAPYAKALGVPVIMTAHDLHHPVCLSAWRRNKIEELEVNSARQADMVFTVSADEHKYFLEQGVQNVLAPSTFDLLGLREKIKKVSDATAIIKQGTGLDLNRFFLFIGSSNTPNIRAKDNFKLLARRAAQLGLDWQFVVAGGCCRANSEDFGNFYAIGKVEDEVLAALYAGCRMIVSPLGSGSTGASIKTVEAMGLGKLVFGNTVTFRGLEVRDGEECFIEDNLDNYLPRLISLLEEGDTAEKLLAVSKKAEQFAAAYDYHICLQPYIDVLRAGRSDSQYDLKK